MRLDNKVQELAHKKAYNELSKTELEFVDEHISQEEYENYYLLFNRVTNHFEHLKLEISKETKDNIFNSFTKEKANKKLSVFNFNNSFRKPILAFVATVIILVSISVFNSKKQQQNELSMDEFVTYTQLENYGLETAAVDEETITLLNMDFKQIVKKVTTPNCDW